MRDWAEKQQRSSEAPGMGRNPRARRQSRQMRDAANSELDRAWVALAGRLIVLAGGSISVLRTTVESATDTLVNGPRRSARGEALVKVASASTRARPYAAPDP